MLAVWAKLLGLGAELLRLNTIETNEINDWRKILKENKVNHGEQESSDKIVPLT